MNIKKIVVYGGLGFFLFMLATSALGLTIAYKEASKEPSTQADSTTPSPATDSIEIKTSQDLKLSEEQKKQIYVELVQAETKAREESEAQYPLTVDGNFDKNYELKKSLDLQYKKAIYSKYNITEKDGVGIIVEGVQNKWPEK